MERSKLAKEKGNNFAKLMTFRKRLAAGQSSSHAAVVSAAMPDRGSKAKVQALTNQNHINIRLASGAATSCECCCIRRHGRVIQDKFSSKHRSHSALIQMRRAVGGK